MPRHYFKIMVMVLWLSFQVIATDTSPNTPLSTPVQFGNLMIFSHINTTNVIAVNRESGSLEWFWAAPEEAYVQGAPALVGSAVTVVYLENYNEGTVVFLDGKTGALLWKQSLPEKAWDFDVKSIDGKLIACGNGLHSLDPKSGKLLWTKESASFQGYCELGALCSDGDSKRLILVNLTDGSEAGSIELPGAKSGWLDRLILKSNDQGITVYRREKGIGCIDIRSGKALWSKPLFDEEDMFLVGKEDVLFIRFDEKTRQTTLEIASLSDGKPRTSGKGTAIIPPGNYQHTLLAWYEESCIVRSGSNIVSLNKNDLSEEWSLSFDSLFDQLPGYLTVKVEEWNEGFMHAQHWNLKADSNKLYIGGGGHQMDPAYLWEVDLKSQSFTWDSWVGRLDEMSEGMAYVHLKGWRGFVNGRFQRVFPIEKHAQPRTFSEGLVAIHEPYDPKKSSTTRYLNHVGKTIFKVVGTGENFNEGLAPLSIYEKTTKLTKAGFIGNDGKVSIPLKFAKVESFSEGLAGVCTSSVDRTDDYGQVESWGYADHTGTLIIPAKYNVVGSFENSVAWVHQGGREIWSTAGPMGWENGTWLLIDKKGNILKREPDKADE